MSLESATFSHFPTARSAGKTVTLTGAAAILLVAAGLLLHYPLSLAGTGARITNVTDPGELSLLARPADRADQRKLLALRGQVSPLLQPGMTPLEKVVVIRRWSRLQQVGKWDVNDNSTSDPLILLHRQRSGIPGTCRRFALTLAGALEAAGFHARVVNASESIVESETGHTLVEVWLPDSSRWILVDSMFDTAFRVDGRLASLLEVSTALRQGRPVAFDRAGSTTLPTPGPSLTEAKKFRHLLYSLAGTTLAPESRWGFTSRPAFAHYSATGELYPEALKLAMLATATVCAAASLTLLLIVFILPGLLAALCGLAWWVGRCAEMESGRQPSKIWLAFSLTFALATLASWTWL